MNGAWRIRRDRELVELYKYPKITLVTTERKLCWAGHVVRATGNRLIKRGLDFTCYGRRKSGRPRHK